MTNTGTLGGHDAVRPGDRDDARLRCAAPAWSSTPGRSPSCSSAGSGVPHGWYDGGLRDRSEGGRRLSLRVARPGRQRDGDGRRLSRDRAARAPGRHREVRRSLVPGRGRSTRSRSSSRAARRRSRPRCSTSRRKLATPSSSPRHGARRRRELRQARRVAGVGRMKAALNVRGVDFAVMPTRDFETAVDFYGSTLGLRRSVFVPDRKYAEFETGNLTLMVIDPPGMNVEEKRGRNPHRAPRRRRACGAHAAGAARDRVHRRHPRLRGVPPGVLRRPGREHAHPAPPLRAEDDVGEDRRVVGLARAFLDGLREPVPDGRRHFQIQPVARQRRSAPRPSRRVRARSDVGYSPVSNASRRRSA